MLRRPPKGPLRLLALSLTLLMLVLSAGCKAGQAKPFTGQLSLWLAPVPGTLTADEALAELRVPDSIDQAVKEFEKAHPNVRVKITSFSWPELNARVEQALAEADWKPLLPDVIAVPPQERINPTWLAKGAIQPLDPAAAGIDPADFYPFALAAFEEGGSLYGVPSWTTVQALYLNLDLFEERGVSAPRDGRWTAEEFSDAVAQLSYARADGTTVAGLGVPLRAGYTELWPLLYGGGARVLGPDGKSFALDSAAGLQALSRLTALRQMTGSQWIGSDRVANLFSAFASPGKRSVAIVPWDSWALTEIRRAPGLAQPPLNLGLAEYPSSPGGNSATIGRAGGYVAFQQSDAARLQAVTDLLRALGSAEAQQGLAALGALPARSTLADSLLFKDSYQARLAAMLPSAELPPHSAVWGKIESALLSEVAASLSGSKLPLAALSDARRQADAALGIALPVAPGASTQQPGTTPPAQP